MIMEESMILQPSPGASASEETNSSSVGNYLASRLKSFGVTHFFTVPGDYNMSLLDEMMGAEQLQLVSCCNELNAGYAADGYARVSGSIGVIVVTFMVGSLSAINAIAGANASDLPILVVCSAPNSNEKRIVHHSLGDGDITHGMSCFQPVTAGCFGIRDASKAQKHIDEAIYLCWNERKPVYLEVSCDLSSKAVGSFSKLGHRSKLLQLLSDEESLNAAVEDAVNKMKASDKVICLIGSKVLKGYAQDSLLNFLDQIGCAFAILPDGKGIVDETHENYIGCFWGTVSMPRELQDVINQADVLLVLGPFFSDYTTVGWTMLLPESKSIFVAPDHVHVCGQRYSFVEMKDFINQLSNNIPKKVNFARDILNTLADENNTELDLEHELTLEFLVHEVNQTIRENTSCVLADTGDCWFIGHKLRLAQGSKFGIQMRYGSIGWALGASLGVATFYKHQGRKRTVVLVGDGAFQVSAQELATLIRYNLNVTIVLVNNGSYNIEEQIHQGPYNALVRWKYGDFVEVVKGDNRNAFGVLADSKKKLREALQRAHGLEGVCLIDCIIDPDDCTEELRRWGELISEYNSRST